MTTNESLQHESRGTTRTGESFCGSVIRLGCSHCDRTDHDGVASLPSDWTDIREVKPQGEEIWETHIGVCPSCLRIQVNDASELDNEVPPWDEGNPELDASQDSIHPIVKQIVDRDCHVGTSNQDVVRHVISKLKGSYSTYRKLPEIHKRLLVEQCVRQHSRNRREYVEVMSGFSHTTSRDDSVGQFLPEALSGEELVALMRKHKVTIESLAFRVGTSMKRVRQLRKSGIQDPLIVRDWRQAITGQDPGPIPSRFSVGQPADEGECCFCGCPLYVGDTAYEYGRSMFCSITCCRTSRGW